MYIHIYTQCHYNESNKNSKIFRFREAPHITFHFLENNMTSIGAQLHGQWNNMASMNAQMHGKWIVLEHQSGFMEVSETLWDWWKFSTHPKEFPETSEDCIHRVPCNSPYILLGSQSNSFTKQKLKLQA